MSVGKEVKISMLLFIKLIIQILILETIGVGIMLITALLADAKEERLYRKIEEIKKINQIDKKEDKSGICKS